MSRWDHEQVFYRVFCITLLGIAFTFTLILTNVFIDIDGLLYNKNKDNPTKGAPLERIAAEFHEAIDPVIQDPAEAYYDNQDYDDNVGRSKRALEPQDLLQHLSNPEIKNIIKDKLAIYLKQFDGETANQNSKTAESLNKNLATDQLKKENAKIGDVIKIYEDNGKVKGLENKKDDILHNLLHNMILQGIAGHVELKQAYEQIQELMKLFTKAEETDIQKHNAAEIKLIDEVANCKALQKDITDEERKEKSNDTNNKQVVIKRGGQKVIIKTVIDIKSIANDKTNQDIDSSKENPQGLIKLIFNGKPMKYKTNDDAATKNNSVETTTTYPKVNNKPAINIQQLISDYIKNNESKRPKRHIKIEYEADNNSTSTNKTKGKNDDELFVEIETHFDSKGLKGDKKKKMIRELVSKIQKALHSNTEVKKKKHARYHVKKRTQNPLDQTLHAIEKKMVMPYTDNLMHRQSESISKNVKLHDTVPHIANNQGLNWQKPHHGPNFLKTTKAINSAELSQVDADYNKVLDNGIPQRLTKPLNSDSEAFNPNDYLNNVKFILKDVEGSGFAIGINQFTDLPPDAESIKLFTGLENILHTYHQKFDENLNRGESVESTDAPYLNVQSDHEMYKRSIPNAKKNDYHSNEYKVIYNNNFLPFDNYQDIYNFNLPNKQDSGTETKKELKLDDSILEKNLRPSEIFSLANMFRKKRSIRVKKILNIKNKKSLNKYLNTNKISKKVVREMKRHKRQINKIRIVARDMSENNQKEAKSSDEEIFFVSDEKVFADRAVVKDPITPTLQFNQPEDEITEKQSQRIEIHSEPQQDIRTEIRHEIQPEPDKDSQTYPHIHQHIDLITPQKEIEDFELTPYVYQASDRDHSGVFAKISRHNALMSKYPHILMDNLGKTSDSIDVYERKYVGDPNDSYEDKLVNPLRVEYESSTATVSESPVKNYYIPVEHESAYEVPKNYDEFNPAIEDKQNYKLSVKIIPKNGTGLNSGFKEIHTSINKSYNRDGLVYTSLVNVSELSKIEKENKTLKSAKYEPDRETVQRLKFEHDKIKYLIMQHKLRLEEQLAQLNTEKEKLEKLDRLVADDETTVTTPSCVKTTEATTVETTTTETTTPSTTTRASTTTRTSTTRASTTTTTTPTTITTTTAATTTTQQPVTPNKDIVNLYKTVQKNDHETKDILRRMTENNKALQEFLNKILKKLTAVEEKTETPNQKVVNQNLDVYEQLKKMFVSSDPSEVIQNDTMAIPFVYAYQHPIPNIRGNISPQANIIYHGHIHTDANPMYAKSKKHRHAKPLHNNFKFKPMILEKEKKQYLGLMNDRNLIKNDTRFFIDEISNDYKIMPAYLSTNKSLTNLRF